MSVNKPSCPAAPSPTIGRVRRYFIRGRVSAVELTEEIRYRLGVIGERPTLGDLAITHMQDFCGPVIDLLIPDFDVSVDQSDHVIIGGQNIVNLPGEVDVGKPGHTPLDGISSVQGPAVNLMPHHIVRQEPGEACRVTGIEGVHRLSEHCGIGMLSHISSSDRETWTIHFFSDLTGECLLTYYHPMDEVFRAINDPSRRLLLDKLNEQDGQTLGELCAHLPEMTRYGVMNHLRVLEEAGLVTTHKKGRSKYHYLNPIPIRLIHDRWISKYAEPRVGAIAGIKARLETGEQSMDKPVHIYKAYIRASVEEVWDAMVNPDKTVQYFYGTRVESSWEVGTPIKYFYPDGEAASDGEIISIDAPKRLEISFQALWDEELVKEGPAREVWSLTDVNGMVELTVELYDVAEDSKTLAEFSNGFPYIISGLKSLVETGEGLPSPG